MKIKVFMLFSILNTFCKEVSFTIEENYDKNLINLTLGNTTTVKFEINLESPLTMVGDMYHEPTPTEERILMGHVDFDSAKNIKYYKMKDIAVDENMNQIDSFFYYLMKTYSYRTSVLSFSYIFESAELSLVHQYYKNNIIQHKRFGLDLTRKQNNKLYLGDFPKEYYQKNHSKCKIAALSPNWSCKLRKITFGNDVYENNLLSFFTLEFDKIIAPNKFLYYLEEVFFGSYIESEICRYVTRNDNSFFICKCNIFEKIFKGVKFQFDDFEISLKDELITETQNEGECRLMISSDKNISNNQWIFGKSLFKKYSLLFDYSKKSIYFFGDIKKNNKKNSPIIFLFMIVIIISGIILIIFTQKYFSRN